MDKLAAGKGSAYDMNEMKHIMHILRGMAHCGLGHTAANPVVQTMEKFPEAYERRLKRLDFEPAFDLDGALETGANDAIVRRICAQLPCRVGGGVRTIARAEALIAAGARRSTQLPGAASGRVAVETWFPCMRSAYHGQSAR